MTFFNQSQRKSSISRATLSVPPYSSPPFRQLSGADLLLFQRRHPTAIVFRPVMQHEVVRAELLLQRVKQDALIGTAPVHQEALRAFTSQNERQVATTSRCWLTAA